MINTILGGCITAICLCGGGAPPETSSGHPAAPGVSVAAPANIPIGAWVEVKVTGWPTMRLRVDEHTNPAFYNRWSIYSRNHHECQKMSPRRNATIRVLKLPR